MDTTIALSEANAALERGEWQAAADAFRRAVAEDETPQALEGLGTALWWQDEQKSVLEVRERAFRLYREQGDLRSAARIATALSIDYIDYRFDTAVASGWMLRAEHLLEGLPLCEEHAWLQLYLGLKALMFDNQPAEARRHMEGAFALAAQLQNIDVEMMAVALDGLLLLREGKTSAGMRRMDEAMIAAVGGEMSALPAIGNTCCMMIYACEAIADYDRASQWLERTREFCRRLGMDAFFAICRNYYATVLIWKGAWDEADHELTTALGELEVQRPGYAQETLAKLGELRRRQGRIEEAETCFVRAGPHRLALLGQARLEIDRRDWLTAKDLLERELRRIGAEDQAEHAFALELLMRVHLETGDEAAAVRCLTDLEAIAGLLGTPPLRATANAASGALAAAKGDLNAAKLQFEDAIDLFEGASASFDAARVRLQLAAVLRSLGRQAAALEQAMIAQTTFKRLGALLYTEAASELVANLSGSLGEPPPASQLPYNLTPREAEVLWLIAAGKTNQEIAEELVLSIRTVERHISTVYEKLQLTGRAARASAAAIAAGLRSHT
jgi:DNA-binding CsgD family transcriptional regulator